MDLDKLTQDIKISLVYVTNLKNENEALQSNISSLEQYVSTLETSLKEKELSYNELLNQKDLNENNVLDKIISLQIDQKLKEDFKKLTTDHDELQTRFQKALKSHAELVEETRHASEEKLADMSHQYEVVVREMKEQQEAKVNELGEVNVRLKERTALSEQKAVEEHTKMQLEFEEKLKVVQRSATSNVNIDIYKRKLAAQRMEHMREIEALRQKVAHLEAASRGGSGRGRKREFKN